MIAEEARRLRCDRSCSAPRAEFAHADGRGLVTTGARHHVGAGRGRGRRPGVEARALRHSGGHRRRVGALLFSPPTEGSSGRGGRSRFERPCSARGKSRGANSWYASIERSFYASYCEPDLHACTHGAGGRNDAYLAALNPQQRVRPSMGSDAADGGQAIADHRWRGLRQDRHGRHRVAHRCSPAPIRSEFSC